MNLKLFAAAIAATLALSMSALAKPHPHAGGLKPLDPEGNPGVVKKVDLPRYMGKWYQIASFPAFFQKDCVANVTAVYKLRTDNTVTVINSCDDKSGERRVAKGLATAKVRSNAKFTVTFLPEFIRWLPIAKGDYWVLKLDNSYRTALVGSPDHKYLWILARTPFVSQQTLDVYVAAAQERGYDTSRLQLTRQTRY